MIPERRFAAAIRLGFEAAAGDILVIKAEEVHSFTNAGEELLLQLDVNPGARFIQENLI